MSKTKVKIEGVNVEVLVMTHEPLFKVEKINNYAYGVYKRDFGSSGGWLLYKTFRSEEDANEYIYSDKWKFW